VPVERFWEVAPPDLVEALEADPVLLLAVFVAVFRGIKKMVCD